MTESLSDRLSSDVLVCDGATGTMLLATGNYLGRALPALNLTEPAIVRSVHESYVDAGVDIIQTNTFGASRTRLDEYHLGDRVVEINQRAVEIAREAAHGRDVFVVGSVSPVVNAQQRQVVGPADRQAALREQIQLLTDAGVDAIALETFGHLDELIEAVDVALDVDAAPVIAQAAFGADLRMLSGHDSAEMVAALADSPIAGLGLNCVVGPHRALQVALELVATAHVPVTMQPNAGLPRRIAPARFEYEIDAEYFVRHVRQALDAGVRIVGGCCGTTPSMLAVIVAAAAHHRERRRPRVRIAEIGAAQSATDLAPTESSNNAARHRTQLGVELSAPLVGALPTLFEQFEAVSALPVDFVTVRPSRGARPALTPLSAAIRLTSRSPLPITASVSTWNRTVVALQAEILGASALGISRFICETGSPVVGGDYPHVDGVWELDSVGLIAMLTELQAGTDCYGMPVPAPDRIEIGARINPGSRELRDERERMRAKIDAGAQFLVTQPIYEPTGLHYLLDGMKDNPVPVLVTLAPLTTFERADLLAHEAPDVHIPQDALDTLRQAGDDARTAGFNLTADLAETLRPVSNGWMMRAHDDVPATLAALCKILEPVAGRPARTVG